MIESYIKELIKEYPNFPKDGILFKDLMPILANPKVYKLLINKMGQSSICQRAENIIAVDARGFLFASAIGLSLGKPIIVARKPGKLPGNLIEESYELEYGKNALSIQKEALLNKDNFVIIDDLLATGGTVNCISNILKKEGKKIIGLSVVVELLELKGRNKVNMEVDSIVKY